MKKINQTSFKADIMPSTPVMLLLQIPLVFGTTMAFGYCGAVIFSYNNIIAFLTTIVFFLSLWGFDYLLTPKCIVNLQEQGMQVSIIKSGLEHKRSDVLYKWEDISSFKLQRRKGEVFIKIYFYHMDELRFSDVFGYLYKYLTQHFPEKELK